MLPRNLDPTFEKGRRGENSLRCVRLISSFCFTSLITLMNSCGLYQSRKDDNITTYRPSPALHSSPTQDPPSSPSSPPPFALGNDHLHGQDQSGLTFYNPSDDERPSFGGNPNPQLKENAVFELALVSFCATYRRFPSMVLLTYCNRLPS